MIKLKKLVKKYWFELIFFTAAFIFSWWLMWHTFAYKEGVMYIAVKAWSDFASHIPLIRSFSLGDNFPPEFPLFPGEKIRYHFLFYALAGFLERLGLRLDWALNLPSAFSFFFLIISIYLLAKYLFQKQSIAILSVTFFLFNGSFSFFEFFKIHPLSWQSLQEILTNTGFSSFGPYDGKIVSAFWNLNIYTNQRHLAAAFAIVLTLCLLIIKPETENKTISFRRAVWVGFLVAFLPFFHSVGFGMAIIILGAFFLLFPKQRKPLLVTLIISLALGLPQLFLIQPGGAKSNFRFRPGYLIAENLNLARFLFYWLINFGLAFFLIPLGFIKSKRVVQKVFLAFLPLFIIGNLFQFSPEIAANHKFFNLFLIIGNIFAAFFISQIWQKKTWGKVIASILIFFSILSGIIDFFAIKNDTMYAINDAPKNPDILWIKENTPPDTFFLNSSFLYHPASLAGRKIFLGWPYFSWSAGYDTNSRGKIFRQLYETRNKSETCKLLLGNKIDYFTVEETSGNLDLPNIDKSYFQNNFIYSYINKSSGLEIFSVKLNCL